MLKRKVFNGLKWSLLSKIFIQIFSWTSTLIVIRILTPEDYGLIAIGAVFFEFVSILAVNGFVSALVKMEKITKEAASQIFTISFLLYLLFGGVIAYWAKDIAIFYGNSEIENLLYVLAIFTPLISFNVVPNAQLQKEMNFKTQAFSETAASLVAMCTVLSGALLGYGYWALVASKVAQIISSAILINFFKRTSYFLTYNFSSAKPILNIAYKMQLNGGIWFIYNKLDSLIIGKYLGINSLGLYNVASEIATLPMDKVSSILNRVGFSAFSSISSNVDDCKYYLSKSLRIMALLIFPVFTGIACIAEEFVVLVLGDKWFGVVDIVEILAIITPFKMLNSVQQNFSKALGELNFALTNTLIISSIVIFSILVGVQYGLVATAWAWLIGFSLAFAVNSFRFQRKFKLKNEGHSWILPFTISLCMLLFISGADYFLLEELIPLYAFCIKVTLGGIFISTFYYLIFFDELKALKFR